MTGYGCRCRLHSTPPQHGIRFTDYGRKKHYTYILTCADGTLYCGWTNHLEQRVKAHNEGRGAKYTKARRPVVLSYWEAFDTKEEAMRREYAIKRLRRGEKLRLIEARDLSAGRTGKI